LALLNSSEKPYNFSNVSTTSDREILFNSEERLNVSFYSQITEASFEVLFDTQCTLSVSLSREVRNEYFGYMIIMEWVYASLGLGSGDPQVQ